MNKIAKQFAFGLSAALAFGIGATSTYAGEAYWTAPVSDNVVVKNAFGLCWRTGSWTPAMATSECDPDLVPKKPMMPKPMMKPAPKVGPPMKYSPPIKPAAPKPMVEKVTMSADAHFDFDKSTLKAEGKAKLNDLVGKLKAVNLEVIIAIGHTDSIGSIAYNKKLSLRRANAVKYYLESMGIKGNRIYTEGKGESRPVASNKTRAGRAKNRRVEIEVVGTRAK